MRTTREYRNAKPFSRIGKGKEQQEAFARYFKGLLVKEARVDLRLFPTWDDCKLATPGDFENCLLVVTAKRQCGATMVLVFRTLAYVDLPQPNGTRAVERFILGTGAAKKAAELIKQFDISKGKKFSFDISSGIVLAAPARSRTLRYINDTSADHRAALLHGTRKSTKKIRAGKKAYRHRKAVSALGVRDGGSGMVHFRPGTAVV